MNKKTFCFLMLLFAAVPLNAQVVVEYTKEILLDGKSIKVKSQNIRDWAAKATVKDSAKGPASKTLQKGEIKQLAEELGLTKEIEPNIHLGFTDGDIAYWYEQKLSESRLRLEFAARRTILEAANKQQVFIEDQGKLSWAAQQIISDLTREQIELAKAKGKQKQK